MLYAQMAMTPGSTAPMLGESPSSFDDETAALRSAVRATVACVLGLGRDHADVEDCTHEALRRALEGRDRLRPGEALRPWLLGIARHVAIDYLRARKRALQRVALPSAAERDGAEQPSPVDGMADPAAGADEQLAQAQQKARVRSAIGALADGPRQALLLVHVEGLGYQEVSQRLGVPLGTVATWIARGRRSIADALREESRSP